MGLSREFATNVERLATPGIPAPAQFERLVFSPVDNTDLPLSPGIAGFLCRAMYASDIALEKIATRVPGEGLVTRKKSPQEAQRAQNDILQSVYDAMQNDPTVSVIGLLNGYLPPFKTLWDASDEPSYRSRLQAIRVSGYSADTASPVRIDGILSDVHKNASLVIVVDDIGDTIHEQAAMKFLLEQLRGVTAHSGRVSELSQESYHPYEYSEALYDEVAREFHDAGVVVAVTVYKNAPFKRSLEKIISQYPDDDPWSKLQKRVLTPSLELTQKDWAMGTSMDSDGQGKDMESILRDELRDEMSDEVEEMIRIISRQKFRIGGFIEGIVVYNRFTPTDLTEFVAHEFVVSIREWIKAGFRWEYMYPVASELPADWIAQTRKEIEML